MDDLHFGCTFMHDLHPRAVSPRLCAVLFPVVADLSTLE